MDSRSHWERIYGEKAPNAVSWFRPHLETSLSLIERVASRDSAIIDVGGGESTDFTDREIACKHCRSFFTLSETKLRIRRLSKEEFDAA